MFPAFDTCSSPIARRDRLPHRPVRSRTRVKTVAVYSDADACAAHVEMADAAVRLGPAPARRVVSAHRQGHRGGPRHRRRGDPPRLRVPLGERAIAAAAEQAGIAFVGPTPDQLRCVRQQAHRPRGGTRRGRPAGSRQRPPRIGRGGPRRGRAHRLPGDAQGGRWRRRYRHAGVFHTGGAARARTTRCSGWRRRTSRRRASSWNVSSPARVTSRCRCSATAPVAR